MVGLDSLASTITALDVTMLIASKAKHHLCDVNFHGEKRGWNFEKYVTVHKEQHHVLTSLEQHGYNCSDDCAKVRFLNNYNYIKTTRLSLSRSLSFPLMNTMLISTNVSPYTRILLSSLMDNLS
jgi:hypothetical protein